MPGLGRGNINVWEKAPKFPENPPPAGTATGSGDGLAGHFGRFLAEIYLFTAIHAHTGFQQQKLCAKSGHIT